MKRDRILISKEKVPYSFNISLSDEIFTLVINYNASNDFFTVALKKGGVTICEAEPIVYGMPLFRDIYKAGDFPVLDIIPIDESGEQNTVTFENFNDTVFLTIDNQGGEEDAE